LQGKIISKFNFRLRRQFIHIKKELHCRVILGDELTHSNNQSSVIFFLTFFEYFLIAYSDQNVKVSLNLPHNTPLYVENMIGTLR